MTNTNTKYEFIPCDYHQGTGWEAGCGACQTIIIIIEEKPAPQADRNDGQDQEGRVLSVTPSNEELEKGLKQE